MKAILISDHAKWCALMMNGKKTIEVRKGTALYKAIQKLIDEYGYAEIYVYCTKGDTLLKFDEDMYICGKQLNGNDTPKLEKYNGSGKVVFKFRCYKVEQIRAANTIGVPIYLTHNLFEKDLCKKSCLTPYDFEDYLNGKTSTAIHISDLKIFDKPRELSEFYSYCKDEKCEYRKNHCSICCRTPLTKAPQSYCFIETED